MYGGSQVRTFLKPCWYLANRKVFLSQGHLHTSIVAALGANSAYFDDHIDALKLKQWVKFPITEAADLTPENKFEPKKEIII